MTQARLMILLKDFGGNEERRIIYPPLFISYFRLRVTLVVVLPSAPAVSFIPLRCSSLDIISLHASKERVEGSFTVLGIL